MLVESACVVFYQAVPLTDCVQSKNAGLPESITGHKQLFSILQAYVKYFVAFKESRHEQVSWSPLQAKLTVSLNEDYLNL